MHKAIIHIGTEKTGSTSIQNFLVKNEKSLADNQFYYPYETCGVISNYRLVLYALNHPDKGLCSIDQSSTLTSLSDKSDDRFLQWKEEFVTHHNSQIENIRRGLSSSTIVYSSEHFHSRTREPEEILRLKALLENMYDDIHICVYLRRQDRLAISARNTAIQGGDTKSMDFNRIGGVPPYYDYAGLVEKWAKVFGEKNITPRVFSRNSMYKGDVIEDFSHHFLGMEANDILNPPPVSTRDGATATATKNNNGNNSNNTPKRNKPATGFLASIKNTLASAFSGQATDSVSTSGPTDGDSSSSTAGSQPNEKSDLPKQRSEQRSDNQETSSAEPQAKHEEAQIAAAPDADKKKKQNSNTRLSYTALSTLIEFNKLEPDDPILQGHKKPRIRHQLINELHNIEDEYGELLPSREEAEIFYSRFKEANDALCEKWPSMDTFNDEGFDMYPPEAHEYPTIDSRAVLSTTLALVFDSPAVQSTS